MNAVAESKAGAHALAQVQTPGRMAVAEIISHVAMVQEVMRAVMKPDIHYGVIPGTDKPTLLKQGAEVLCMAFRVADSYQVEDLSTAETVRYRVTCIGTHQVTGLVLGSGMGSASSGEVKYKWVKAFQEEWEATPEHLRRKKFGWDKVKRQKYEVLQVRTDPADLDNTILKMANKRAKIAMTINVTACGDMFGQDLDDMDDALRDHLTRHGEEAEQAEAEWPADVLQRGTEAASKGTKEYGTFWKAMDPALREKLVKTRQHEKFKQAAIEADSKQPIKDQPSAAATPAATAAPSTKTFDEVMAMLCAAQNLDALYVAGDWIEAITDPTEKETLVGKFDEIKTKLEGNKQ